MKFWKFLRACPHKFCWPRLDGGGRHYQVCLLCGTAYEYDWNLMRRTKRLILAAIQPDAIQASQPKFR